MLIPLIPDMRSIRLALACKCPRCGEGRIYEGRLTITVRESCPVCGLRLAANDSADGPAVFLIFIFGALLVPIALWIDHVFAIPLWVHGILWTIVVLFLTLAGLRPMKAYVIALQYKFRPGDWG